MSRYCHRVGADAQKKKTRDERSSPKPKKAPPQWAEQSPVSSDAAAVQERRRRLVVWRSTSMRSKRVPRSADVQLQPPPSTESFLRLVRRDTAAASPSASQARSYGENRPTVSSIQAAVRKELANASIHPHCSILPPTTNLFQIP
ncbi:hypothetical protein HPB52_014473 [Rhipicephalus sanguineus]|uniref:Uncharacterized protein n=1 Tax=Rhipicephalus sanguineus TaxID=34632 RepID=A0A9D4T7M6_RHISA|nr:hypothetical protein HPB52_014473 [Rhipicephalus sanguineus]